MSAFQPYAGSYEAGGVAYNWRCYATTRVHEVRSFEAQNVPRAPGGKRWIVKSRREGEPKLAWLVDETIVDFSHMLLQVDGQPAQTLTGPAPRQLATAF